MKENTASIIQSLIEVKEAGVQAALFPEFATIGFHAGLLDGISQQVIKESLNEISRQCALCGVAVIVGTAFFPDSSEQKPFNAAVIFDEAGNLIHVSSKLDLDEKGEARIFSAADSRQCFSLLGHRCAIIICREIAWPTEQLKTIICEQPEMLFWPGPVVNSEENEPMAKAVARAFGAWLVQSTWADWLFSAGLTWGRSWVINPSAEIVHEGAPNAPCISIVEVGAN